MQLNISIQNKRKIVLVKIICEEINHKIAGNDPRDKNEIKKIINLINWFHRP